MIDAAAKRGIQLGDAWGENEPIISRTEITLNGLVACGHRVDESIVIPWPAEDAGGIAFEGENAVSGSWFAGATLLTRTCSGDCSYETFRVRRALKIEEWQRPQRIGGQNFYFDFCKTAYRPYDLVVTAILLAAKHRFKELFHVSSDGTDAQWWDTKLFTYAVLGFGPEYAFRPGGEKESERLVQVHDSPGAALGNATTRTLEI